MTQPDNQSLAFPSSSITQITNTDEHDRAIKATHYYIDKPTLTDAEDDELNRIGDLIYDYEQVIYRDDLSD